MDGTPRFDDPQLEGLSPLLESKVLKVVDRIQSYVSGLDDSSPFDRTELAGSKLDDDEFILEWMNGWGRVQFILCEDEDYEEVAYMDNRRKERVPRFSYLEFDMYRLPEIVSEAANFIESFS